MGDGVLLGFRCIEYRAKLTGGPRRPIRPDVATLEASPDQSIRLWEEPRTGLILRHDRLLEFGGSASIPPRRTDFRLSRLRFSSGLPAARFRLPVGAAAVVPRLFRDAPIPEGVTRVELSGTAEGTGIDFQNTGPTLRQAAPR